MKESVLIKILCVIMMVTILPGYHLSAQENTQNNDKEIKITDLEIKGNDTVSDKEIKENISTESPSIKPWADRPVFDEQVLSSDMVRIKELYDSHGYYDAAVEYALDYSDDKSEVEITIKITEGDPIILRKLELRISGEEDKELKDQIIKLIELKEGEVFSSNKFQSSKATIRETLSDRGYPKAKVQAEARVNRRLKWADTNILIEPGERYRFGSTSISGNDKISSDIIKRELAYKEGQLYSLKKISDTQSNIFETGLFKSVSIDTSLNEVSRTAEMKVKVSERKPGTVKVGVGFGTEDLLRGQISWTQRDFFGGARVFDITGKFSFITQRIETSIKQPYIFGRDSDYKGIVNFQRDDLPSYEGKSLNLTNRLDKKISRELNTYAAFDLLYAKIDSQTTLTPLEESRQNVFLTTLDAGFEYFGTDNLLNPTRGFVSILNIETSLSQLGSEVDYFKTVFEMRGYKKYRDIVFAKRMRIGLIDSFGDTADLDVPIFKRFFAGGSASMRGFAFQKLGPLNESEDPLGGNSLIIGNAEARFPLYKDFGGVVFFDYGNVFPRSYDYKLDDLRYAAGLGFRYNTLVGPVRVDFGYALNPDPDLGRFQIFISVGQAF